jgi:phenylalanyl-tRNA synthetase alpha chain
MTDLTDLLAAARASIGGAADPAALDAVRIEYLGKKGKLTELMKGLGAIAPEQRKERGAALNQLKNDIAAELGKRTETLQAGALDARLAAETVDITLPARAAALPEGRIHPISQTIEEIVSIFGDMGFAVAEGPDIEEDFYNFSALNIPPEHPARQTQDTFYLNVMTMSPGATEPSPMVLRTHTSPVQIRTMMSQKPPIRIIVPGRTYRSDHDATHSPNFHQVEGLVIDTQTHMGHLKGCLIDFARTFFDVPDLPLRFRPSHFPFTEPSAEVDIGCSRKGGELKIGNFGDWLEVLGCGMVHPKVIANCGLDPAVYQGFAFGMGIERMAMLKYGIPDLRTFYEADLRWLRHYGFMPVDLPSTAGGLAR